MAKFVISNCHFEGGSGSGSGCGIYAVNGAEVEIHGNTTVSRNGMHGLSVDSTSSVRIYGKLNANNNDWHGISVQQSKYVKQSKIVKQSKVVKQPKTLKACIKRMVGLIRQPSLEVLRSDLTSMVQEIKDEFEQPNPKIRLIQNALLALTDFLDKVTQEVASNGNFKALHNVVRHSYWLVQQEESPVR